MPTRPIPSGTCNASANMPVPMWRQFCRLAYLHDQSAGERVRLLIAADLEAARARGLQLVRDTRQMLMPFAAALMLALGALGFLATTTAAVLGNNQPRRPGIVRVLKLHHRRREGWAA